MLCKARIKFLSHGKHNNLHFSIDVGGTKRNPLFFIKLVLFFETANAYILHCNLHSDYIDLINFNILTKVIQDELDKHDYKLVVSDMNDFRRKRFKTEQILKQLKDG